jgi:hypothetical protein
MADQDAGAGDKIRRALVRIRSVRENLPSHHNIEETHVQEYSAALRHLEEAGYDIAEFGVPEAWLAHRVIMTGPRGTVRAKTRSVERSLFLTKIDAVLGYFAGGNGPIGFTGPRGRG